MHHYVCMFEMYNFVGTLVKMTDLILFIDLIQ